MTNSLLYLFFRALVAFIQALPLRVVARLGRAAGGIAFHLDARHRDVALRNLAMCFGKEKSAAEIRMLAKENFRRLGENYCSAIKTAAMTAEQMKPHFTFIGAEKVRPAQPDARPQSRVVAVGHFGNFELYDLARTQW